MQRSSGICSVGNRRLRQLLALVACTTVVGALAALPTASASARPPTITALPPVEVGTLLAETPLATLNAQQLAETLSSLPGFGAVSPAILEEALEKTIQTLSGKGGTLGELLESGTVVPTLESSLKEALGPLSPLLESLLGGNPATKLTEALQGVGGTELVGKLLQGSAEPEALIAEILAALNPEKVDALLGSTPVSEAFDKATVGQLATELETTPQALDEDLGQTLPELPETAMALTTPLANGTELGVMDSVKGLVMGLLDRSGAVIEGGSGAEGGKGGSGGGAGAGGGNGNSIPASTTVVVENTIPQAQALTSSTGAPAGKLRVLSHRVKGRAVMVLVEVPGAGKLTLVGGGIRSMHRETAKAERVSLKATLTKAGVSSLHKHHHLKVTVKVSFKQTGGPSSTATVPVAFH